MTCQDCVDLQTDKFSKILPRWAYNLQVVKRKQEDNISENLMCYEYAYV